jgi:hypothetical protein
MYYPISGGLWMRACLMMAQEGVGQHSHLDSSLRDRTDDRYPTFSYISLPSIGAISWTTAQNTIRAQYIAQVDAANHAA